MLGCDEVATLLASPINIHTAGLFQMCILTGFCCLAAAATATACSSGEDAILCRACTSQSNRAALVYAALQSLLLGPATLPQAGLPRAATCMTPIVRCSLLGARTWHCKGIDRRGLHEDQLMWHCEGTSWCCTARGVVVLVWLECTTQCSAHPKSQGQLASQGLRASLVMVIFTACRQCHG